MARESSYLKSEPYFRWMEVNFTHCISVFQISHGSFRIYPIKLQHYFSKHLHSWNVQTIIGEERKVKARITLKTTAWYFWFVPFHLKDIRNRECHPYMPSVTPLLSKCMKKVFSDCNFTKMQKPRKSDILIESGLSNSSKTIQCPLQVFLLYYHSRKQISSTIFTMEI